MKKEKIKKLPVYYNEEVYKKIPLAHLIIFGIYSVSETNKKCTFERLVKECFTLFPQSFGFSENPEWPDSRKLDRPLRMLKNKKLITGDPQSSFFLTGAGKKLAGEIAKNFRQKKLFK